MTENEKFVTATGRTENPTELSLVRPGLVDRRKPGPHQAILDGLFRFRRLFSAKTLRDKTGEVFARFGHEGCISKNINRFLLHPSAACTVYLHERANRVYF